MMTQPEQQTRDDLDRRFLEASRQPRGDWGNVAFVITDDEDEGQEEGDRVERDRD